MHLSPRLLLVALLLALAVLPAAATEQMALETGRACGHCHLDPAGGGELTAAGEAYLEAGTAAGTVETLTTGHRVVRFLAGYLHMVFAVLWFGTILYVHIVLKPAYAESGLPRGEKFVGVLSFWVVGLTGVVLTLYRVDSWAMLVETRFGILLTVKVILYLTMLISAVLVIKVISPRLARREAPEHVPGEPFTTATLQAFNGRDGQPCYFAYRGKVYDAGDSKLWQDGEHMRRHDAGRDLTADLPMAPHEADVIERLPVVGKFREEGGPSGPSRAFYVVAYMNLVIVFLILLVIALWRWS